MLFSRWSLSVPFLLLSPLLAAFAATPDPAYPLSPPGLTIQGDKLSCRPDLAFAAAFVHTLASSGVKVKALDHSIYNGFFDDAHEAARVSTDAGVVEVVVFPYDVATKVKVTRSYDAEGGVYVFAVQRHAGPHGTTAIDSPCKSAILMAGRYFILTDSERLAKVVQQALHPVSMTDVLAL
jgi:hypothetical protein